jgi:endoglucanase Acf2
MYNTAFIVSLDSLDKYNQIRGKDMTGYFRDNELYQILVDGNSQTLYYIRDDDETLIGVDLAESSEMIIMLKQNKVDKIIYMSKISETTYPEEKLPPDMKHLKGFNWKGELRPVDKMDIFRKPGGR